MVRLLSFFVCVWVAKADTTVVLLRHTFRSFQPHLQGGYSNFDQINNYTASPWPEYDVPPKDATKRGLELAKQLGSFLPQKLALEGPISFIADTAERDIDTASYIADGMRENSQNNFQVGNVTTDASLFSPWKFIDGCDRFGGTERGKAVSQQLDVVPHLPWSPGAPDYPTLLSAMQNITGKGAAPLLKDIPNVVSPAGYYNGQSFLVAKFSGNFDLEYGNNVPVGWGKVTTDTEPNNDPSNMYNLLAAHAYYRAVNMKAPEVASRDSSNLFNAILAKLDAGENGVTFILGHDADIDKVSVLLGVQFRLRPYNLNGVAPISGLQLTLSSAGQLTVSYIGTAWEPQGASLQMSDVLKVPAPFVSDIYKEASGDINAMSTVTYRDHRDAWVGKMFPACVQNPIFTTTAKPNHKSDSPLVVGVSVTVVGLVIVVVAAIVVVSVMKRKGGAKSRYAGKRSGTSYGSLES